MKTQDEPQRALGLSDINLALESIRRVKEKIQKNLKDDIQASLEMENVAKGIKVLLALNGSLIKSREELGEGKTDFLTPEISIKETAFITRNAANSLEINPLNAFAHPMDDALNERLEELIHMGHIFRESDALEADTSKVSEFSTLRSTLQNKFDEIKKDLLNQKAALTESQTPGMERTATLGGTASIHRPVASVDASSEMNKKGK